MSISKEGRNKMNTFEYFLENRRCSHCLGKAHETYKEDFECCKAQFEKDNRAWKIAESMTRTREVIKENLPNAIF
jgi:hypothetical protein